MTTDTLTPIANLIRANKAELTTLAFTYGGADWPYMASCNECGALVPFKASDLIDACGLARKHRDWHERGGGLGGAA